MKLPALLVADLHLTANPRDEYRWGLWAWLRDTIVKEKVRTLAVLGDLSDAKDFHPSSLVNRIASEVRLTAECYAPLHIKMIPGNHEWFKQGEEFWRFLNFVHERVEYMVRPTEDYDADGRRAYFLPFTKNPAKDWQGMNFEDYDFVFMHQTLHGAVASNGQKMEGEDLPTDILATAGKVWSGDIHVPQVVGHVEYVGSPYHVHFGDNFKPRVVLLENNGRAVDLHYDSPRRLMVKVHGAVELDGLRRGDQVKVVVELAEYEKHQWQTIRRKCLEALRHAGVECCGVELRIQKQERWLSVLGAEQTRAEKRTPTDDVLRFVEAEELPASALDIAQEIIES